MSRIGNNPVTVLGGVDVQINGQHVKAKGSKGELELMLHPEVAIKMEDVANDDGKTEKVLTLSPKTNSRMAKQVWPTMRTLVDNIIIGVSKGYEKNLEIHGVGFRANLQGNTLIMTLGFSHEVKFAVPEGIKIEVIDQTKLKVSGIDKQQVGEVAAKIRAFKKPEPYKGKGIRYAGEYILKKEGKKK